MRKFSELYLNNMGLRRGNPFEQFFCKHKTFVTKLEEINKLNIGIVLSPSEPGYNGSSDKLKQAEEDMGQVDMKTKEVLKTLGIEDPTVEDEKN